MKWISRALAAAALLTTAQAQTAPNPIPPGTITLVVPLAAGGPLDSLARVFGERLSARMGRNVIIENKAGAGGNIGAAYVAKSKPDGLTWLYTIDSVITVNPHIYNSQGFDAAKDLVPAARTGHNFNILAVNAKRVEAKSFAELLELSKTRSLSFASAGIGSPGHLAYEYLRIATGMKGEHVPYRGAAPALQDLVAGVVDAAFVTAGAIMPHVESGALRALATSTSERASQMPNVPTAEQAGIKGFEARFGNYMMSPAGVDPAIRAFMAEQLREIMKDPDVQKRMIIQGSEPVFGDEKDSIARIASDRAKWGQVMKAAGVKAE
jgi:tripartite-type tricarboxylate transporter receptor subunit TctC